MSLRPLYTVRFNYPEGWEVLLTGPLGTEEHHFYVAEGRCVGEINGRFRAGNHPRRRTDKTFAMDMQGVIETDDGAHIRIDYQGYGRAYPPGRRQVVGAAWHLSGHEKYSRLNDAVCTIAGEVRAPTSAEPNGKLVFAVSELIWEPPPD